MQCVEAFFVRLLVLACILVNTAAAPHVIATHVREVRFLQNCFSPKFRDGSTIASLAVALAAGTIALDRMSGVPLVRGILLKGRVFVLDHRRVVALLLAHQWNANIGSLCVDIVHAFATVPRNFGWSAAQAALLSKVSTGTQGIIIGCRDFILATQCELSDSVVFCEGALALESSPASFFTNARRVLVASGLGRVKVRDIMECEATLKGRISLLGRLCDAHDRFSIDQLSLLQSFRLGASDATGFSRPLKVRRISNDDVDVDTGGDEIVALHL